MIVEVDKKNFSQACRNRFFETYKYHKPLIIKNAIDNSSALTQWNYDYLVSKVGDAKIILLKYQEESNDFDQAIQVDSTLSAFLANLLRGNPDRTYWFNILASGNFWRNPDYQVPMNNALKALESDFDLNGLFIDKQLVYSQLVLGGSNVSTKLHFDWGGEAKFLTQIIGKKEIYLIHPSNAKMLSLNPTFGSKNIAASPINLWDEEVLQELQKKIDIYHAVIEPGDILYWPSYWLHSVSNMHDITLAVNTPVDELPLSNLFIRQCFAHLTSELFNEQALGNLSFEMLDTIRTSIQKVERDIIAKAPSSLFEWSSAWPKDPFN